MMSQLNIVFQCVRTRTYTNIKLCSFDHLLSLLLSRLNLGTLYSWSCFDTVQVKHHNFQEWRNLWKYRKISLDLPRVLAQVDRWMPASSRSRRSTNDIAVGLLKKIDVPQAALNYCNPTTATLAAAVLVGSRCASVSQAKPRLLCSNDCQAYVLTSCGCVCKMAYAPHYGKFWYGKRKMMIRHQMFGTLFSDKSRTMFWTYIGSTCGAEFS